MSSISRYRRPLALSSLALLCLTAGTIPSPVVFAQAAPAAVPAAPALPFVASPFTDNMVLQRDQPDTIWGWTTPGTTVTVTVAGPTTVPAVTGTAGPDGKWSVKTSPVPAGGPYTVTVAGPQTVTFQNVLFGDVWICSGQSNMEFGIKQGQNAETEIANANYPQIRLFTTDKVTAAAPLLNTKGQWQVCTPDTIVSQGTWGGFTAVGYFFGRALNQNLKVPIGLLETSWGGTPAEAWVSGPSLSAALPDAFGDRVKALASADPTPFATQVANWYAAQDAGTGAKWQDPAFDATAWSTIPVPGVIQQAGVPELAKFNGVIWFRRNFDLGDPGDAGKAAVLHLQAGDGAALWVNGTRVNPIGDMRGARNFAVPAGLLKATGNVVAARVLNLAGRGGIVGEAGATELQIGGGTDVPLAGPWSYQIGWTMDAAHPFPKDPGLGAHYPTMLFNGMIAPLVPYGIKGALWYQGESNAGAALQYRTLLPALINDWHAQWGEGNFPFLIVQLAGFQPGGASWPELRQAQWLTAQNVPGAGIMTAIDIGDPTNIHPKDKQDVGARLALVALNQVYGQNVEDSGPVFKSATVEGTSIRVSFTHLGGGLVVKGDNGLTAFEVAGADGVWVPADAKIDNDTVVVTASALPLAGAAPAVAAAPAAPAPAAAAAAAPVGPAAALTAPVSVRYAWSGYPACSLYNAAGLPAFPFNTAEK